MFTRDRTTGLFLEKADQGEANQVFTVYTRDFGKLKITAKAVRKIKSKLKAGAEIFYCSEIEFIQGRAHKILTDAVPIKKFYLKDLSKLQIAYKITGALDGFVKGEEKDKQIWDLTTEVLQKLEDQKGGSEIIYYYFFWNFVSLLGYRPEIWHCVSCQKRLASTNLFFNLAKGGVVCEDCFSSKRFGKQISPDVVKILRIFSKKDWLLLSKLKINSQCWEDLATLSKDYSAYIFSLRN